MSSSSDSPPVRAAVALRVNSQLRHPRERRLAPGRTARAGPPARAFLREVSDDVVNMIGPLLLSVMFSSEVAKNVGIGVRGRFPGALIKGSKNGAGLAIALFFRKISEKKARKSLTIQSRSGFLGKKRVFLGGKHLKKILDVFHLFFDRF